MEIGKWFRLHEREWEPLKMTIFSLHKVGRVQEFVNYDLVGFF